jgi:hypothetical protein
MAIEFYGSDWRRMQYVGVRHRPEADRHEGGIWGKNAQFGSDLQEWDGYNSQNSRSRRRQEKNAKMTAITARNAFCDTRSMEQQGYGDDWVDWEFKLFLDGSLEIRSASHRYLR